MKTTENIRRFMPILSFFLLVFGQTDVSDTASAAEPKEAVDGSIDSDIFGPAGGYIHPSISSSITATDNYNYSSTNKSSDTIITISPGIWISPTKIKEQPKTSRTSSVVPGGQATPQASPTDVGRFFTYAAYQGDYSYYDKHTEDNAKNHLVIGALQYRLTNGLTIGANGQISKATEPRDTSSSTELARYTDNLVGLNMQYKIGQRLQLESRLSQYAVKYDDPQNSSRDRVDRTVSVSLPYSLTAKTAAFLGFSLTDIQYDQSTEKNSQDKDVFVGVSWKLSGKSTGRVQIGYGTKTYEEQDLSSESYVSLGANFDYALSTRTSVQVAGSRKMQESTDNLTDSVLADTVSATYTHRFTPRCTGLLTARYERDAHQGALSSDRTDDIYLVRPSVRYLLGQRYNLELNYTFEDRKSTLDEYTYRANSVMVLVGVSF